MDAIKIHLNAVRIKDDKEGIIDLDEHEPGRTAEIRDGRSNIGVGYRLRFDADGHPDYISKSENDKIDNVKWTIVTDGKNVATYTLVPAKKGDFEVVKDGKGPFDGVRSALAGKTHFNVFTVECIEGPGSTCTVQQARTVTVNRGGKDQRIEYTSNVLGPYKIGRQG